MKLTLLLALLGAAAALTIPKSADYVNNLEGDALREYVNSVQNLWKAGVPKRDRSKSIMHSKYVKVPELEGLQVVETVAADLPDSFDARTAWPQCPTIGEIRDQSQCGSCWAFGAAEAISDRTCIHSALNVTISADDILSCCGYSCGSGCDGGYPIQAWKWWTKTGVCTGGGFYENTFCKPYPIEPCGTNTDENGITHTNDDCKTATTPACVNSCTNTAYTVPYAQDKHKGRQAYKVGKTVDAIKTEILTNGPVEAAFTVYKDFYDYTSGIYKHVSGREEGGHAVKILGWGSENGTPYWLVANSWDTNWGENGFFRILQGTDECGIEDGIVAGLP